MKCIECSKVKCEDCQKEILGVSPLLCRNGCGRRYPFTGEVDDWTCGNQDCRRAVGYCGHPIYNYLGKYCMNETNTKIYNILVKLTDITGLDHTTSALEAFVVAETDVKLLIAQAIAEDRERVERNIKQAWNYPCNCDRKNILCSHNFSQMKLALSFLNTPLTINNKDI